MNRLLGLLLMSASAFAWQPIDNLNQISTKIASELPGLDPKRVLLVFDIDETLIQTPEYQGSSLWFDEHASQLKDSKFASSFGELLAHNTVIKSTIEMEPTQSDMKDIVKDLQGRGYPSMALTARGAGLGGPAVIELKKEGVSFYKQLEIETPLSIDPKMPFDPATVPGELGITPARAAEMGLAKSPRPIAWMYGILLTTGQNKGGLLRWFLKDSSKNFDAIVFVDDTLKHVENVENAFADTSVKVLSLHYIQVAPVDESAAAKAQAQQKDHEYLQQLNIKN